MILVRINRNEKVNDMSSDFKVMFKLSETPYHEYEFYIEIVVTKIGSRTITVFTFKADNSQNPAYYYCWAKSLVI